MALALSGLLALSGPTLAADPGDPAGLYGADTAFLTSSVDTVGTGATYYVDCAAAGNGTGTKASSFDGVHSMNQTAVLKPGDAVAFKRGTSCMGQVHTQYSGSKETPITYGSYGTGKNSTLKPMAMPRHFGCTMPNMSPFSTSNSPPKVTAKRHAGGCGSKPRTAATGTVSPCIG